MMEEEEGPKRKKVVEAQVLDRVGEVISGIKKAKHVDQVICSLHSLAILLFPLDSSLLSGSIDERYRNQILSAKVPSSDERNEWWQAFYRGTGFPAMARVLLREVASNWLACFPISARRHVYDAFLVNGLMTEVVQTLVPCLQPTGTDGLDVQSVRSNTERLIILCLLENDGVVQMAREFGSSCQTEDSGDEHFKTTVSMVAQVVSSIPDKAQMGAPVSLSSHLFFRQITIQLLSLAEERNLNLVNGGAIFNKSEMDSTFLFVGEIFSRICRRGSADVLVNEIVRRVLRLVQSILSSNDYSLVADVIGSNPASQFWLNMMLSIKDSYAVERMSEKFLHELATQRVSDVEAYWILWLLFCRNFAHQASFRAMFVDKFLFWKVFPVCCLRWILHFALLERPPDVNLIPKGHTNHNFLETLQHLVSVWSKREFVQSATTEQQICILFSLSY
ncbi:hypothetical protein PanWU01x14_257430 [Parasponia andersonii]|uniref:TELO2 ARM repeat domain-containing protein n=1 Tax=Parasponia andersonii TaxID=3476 RepID=A0A2P5BA14_PARAD|nr:hypothetical protein PanWU01x14_257430 [Parasponia andersonii]